MVWLGGGCLVFVIGVSKDGGINSYSEEKKKRRRRNDKSKEDENDANDANDSVTTSKQHDRFTI